MATVELRFGALPLHVRTARLVAASLGRRVGVPEPLIDEVKLAVGEACSRAVSVQRSNDPDGLVLVRLTDGDGTFCVEVLDTAPAGTEVAAGASAREMLDAAQVGRPEEDPGDLPPGLGLALLEGLVDDVTVAARDDGPGTAVVMRWSVADLPVPRSAEEDAE